MGDGEGIEITGGSQYLSEACLWTAWSHQGLAQAAASTRIFCLSCEAFATVARKHPIVLNDCIDYGSVFHACLNKAIRGGEDVDDTFRAFENRADLLDSLATTLETLKKQK